MAYRLTWTNRALGNLDEIRSYIARDSPTNATRMIRKLFTASDSLKLFPNMGRVVPEDDRDLRRELIVWPYRVIYEVDSATETVSVTRVIHGGRNLAEVFRLDPD